MLLNQLHRKKSINLSITEFIIVDVRYFLHVNQKWKSGISFVSTADQKIS